VFSKNADYIEMLLKDKENEPDGKKLQVLLHNMDRAILYFFFAGTLTTIVIAAHHGFTKLGGEEISVSDKKTIKTTRDSSTASVGKGGGVKPGTKGASK